MIALCTEQGFRIIMVMFLFLWPQFSEGWIGQELPGSQSKIALHLCSENRGCDELLVQHRRFTSEGFLFHEHPGCIFSAANGHKEGHKSALLQKILCWFIPSKGRKSASFYNGFWNDSVRREMWAGM